MKLLTHGNNALQNSVEDLVEEKLDRAASILTCARGGIRFNSSAKAHRYDKIRIRLSQSVKTNTPGSRCSWMWPIKHSRTMKFIFNV